MAFLFAENEKLHRKSGRRKPRMKFYVAGESVKSDSNESLLTWTKH